MIDGWIDLDDPDGEDENCVEDWFDLYNGDLVE